MSNLPLVVGANGLLKQVQLQENDIQNLQSDLSTLTSSAGTAQSTANTAVTNAATAQTAANNAQSTANTAVSNAAAAQSTANTGVANAATAQAQANLALSTAQEQMSTGPLWGLTLQANSNTGLFNITSGAANFVDSFSTPGTTTVNTLNLPSGITGITPSWGSTSLGRHPVYVSMNSSGTVLQSTVEPTLDSYTEYAYLGIIAVDPVNQIVDALYPYCSYTTDIVNRFNQLCLCLKSFNVSGNAYTPSVVSGSPTLNIARGAGQIFRIGSNTANDLRSPDAPLTNASDPEVFFPISHSSGNWYYPDAPVTALDPNYYDNLTNLTAMTTGYFQIKPVFYSPQIIFMQYGQAQYPTMADAVSSVNGAIMLHPALATGDFVWLGWWIVQQGCTDLNNTSQAVYLERSGIAGASGSSGGEANTTASVGTAGISIIPPTDPKTGVVLNFCSIEGDGETISVTYDAAHQAVQIAAIGSTAFNPALVSYYARMLG
jgi:hypothetical protein